MSSGQDKQEIEQLKKHIEDMWEELTVVQTEDTDSHYGLSHPFVAPSVHRTEGFVFKEQFYWDSYFTMVGLAASGKRGLAKGMVSNLLELQKRFGYIPNSNNKQHGGRSQPPILSSMLMAGYVIDPDKRWLEDGLKLLEQEYHLVWRGHEQPHVRDVHRGLSRYYHESESHYGAEEESGWDYTNRFDSRALDFLPIDLNALLFKYEIDIAAIHELLDHSADDWYHRAEKRKTTINELMWNEKHGLFFDYDYQTGSQSQVASLATYLPMFVGMATPKQAQALVDNLVLFETAHGLTATAIDDTDEKHGRQWMSPNGWAPLHFLVVEGLKRYGFHDEAKRIAEKWVATVSTGYKSAGVIAEKYNVVDTSKPPVSAVYPDQIGFGWTNAVTLHFINSFLD